MSTTSVARLQSKAMKAATTEVMHVTPEMAQKFLTANTHNRKLQRALIGQYARAMASGEWFFNGETLKIAGNGQILDGQHRFHAVIESGETVPLLIVRGILPEAQDTMDVGKKRSNPDILQLHGESNTNTLSAIGRRAFMYDLGFKTNAGGRFVPSELEIRRYIESNPSIYAAVEVAVKGRKKANIPGSVLGLAFFLCSRIDHLEAKSFFLDQVVNGLGLHHDDPAHALRNILRAQQDRPGRVAETDVLGYVLRAWNAFRGKERLTKMQAPKGGWNNSNIPDPI